MLQKENRKPLILVAEDTDSNFLLISVILKKEYEIIRATSGIEVIKLEEVYNPDVILMDIRMPEMDGIEALKKIKAADANASIIMCSAMLLIRTETGFSKPDVMIISASLFFQRY